MALLWLFLNAVFTTAPRPSQLPDEHVAGRVARFFRGDRTLVDGFVRVPHRMLAAVSTGAGGFAAYRVEFSVSDANGTVLASDGWTRRLPLDATGTPGAESVEPFSFAVAPGRYDVRIVVSDSGSGASETVDVPVTGFSGRPQASDLLLSSGIRRVSGSDTVPAAGELRKGKLLIASGPDLAVTPGRPGLWYYCEVYRDSAGTVPWLLRVIDAGGRVVVTTPPTRTSVPAGGGQIAASIDLAGLPPGDYTLALVTGEGVDTVSRAARFRMASFETERLASTTADPRDLYTDLGEAQLDSLYAPLVYLAEPEELRPYVGLSVGGKQRFLRDFWRRRDPTPGTPDNDAESGFYARIAAANRRFREPGSASVPGWRTDRGRVFIRYGDPDEIRREPQSGPDRPWEAWKYTRIGSLKFVFLDLTRLGNYSLIFSNDKLERSPGDWQRLLSASAVTEISNF